uniref:Uncharacterized protein n=1 Tax=Tanacetum cinerariifolium TaxID=118510 RepID=A0A699HZV2_TANCI|nr:hypothetical protein [Tanacetum cinerariifolium]
MGIHSTLTDKQQKSMLKKLYTLVKSNYVTLHYSNSSPRLKFSMNIASEGTVSETSGPIKLEEMRRFVLGDDLERMMAAFDISELGENSHIRRAGGYVLHTELNEPGFEDNKLKLTRLALVKIRLEDTPSSITWEEKHQPDGPGLKYLVSYLSGYQSFAEANFDQPVCNDDIRSPEIIAIVNLELNILNFPDMCAKETHSCLLKSHFENVTSSALDFSSLHWIVTSSTIS